MFAWVLKCSVIVKAEKKLITMRLEIELGAERWLSHTTTMIRSWQKQIELSTSELGFSVGAAGSEMSSNPLGSRFSTSTETNKNEISIWELN